MVHGGFYERSAIFKRRLTMNKTSIIILTTIFMAMCIVVGSNAAEAPKSIVIGALVSMTGPDALTGQPSKAGYQLGVDMINAQGGVLVKEFGKKIPLEIVFQDMETNPEKAIGRAEALNSRYKATAVVGTTLINATADIFEKNKLPAVTMLVAIDSVFEKGLKYYFTVGKLNSDSAKGFIGVLNNLPKDKKPTKIAMAVEQTHFVMELAGFMKKEAAAAGMSIVYEGKYAMLSPDMSQIIMQAKNSGADVFFGAPVPPDAITMLKQMNELDYHPKAIIFNRATDDQSWAKMGDLVDFTIGSPDWVPALNFPGVKELNEKVKAQTGEDASFAIGPGVASIQVIAAAIEKAGTLNREKVRDAIAATDMMTVTGPVKFQSNGKRQVAIPVVTQWQKGKTELVWPTTQKVKPLVYPRP
jgi:branched-chain amino acid transport system substrate-binding protein